MDSLRKLLPTKRQWNNWSLPSKLAAIGVLLSLIGISVSLAPIITALSQSQSQSQSNELTIANEHLSVGLARGQVFTKTENGEYAPVSSARLLFNREDMQVHRETLTDNNGNYSVLLPEGRYNVLVMHHSFFPHSTFPGFNVIAGDKENTGNFALQRRNIESSDKLPPVVGIVASSSKILRNEPFHITVYAEDDVGLETIWWFGERTGDADLDVAHLFECGGKTFCRNTGKVSTPLSGKLVFAANARDTAYGSGQPHQASEGKGLARIVISSKDSP